MLYVQGLNMECEVWQTIQRLISTYSFIFYALSTVHYSPPLGLGLGSLICVTAVRSMQMLLQLLKYKNTVESTTTDGTVIDLKYEKLFFTIKIMPKVDQEAIRRNHIYTRLI